MLLAPDATVDVCAGVAPSAGRNRNCVDATPAGNSQKRSLGRLDAVAWAKVRSRRPWKWMIRKVGRKVMQEVARVVARKMVVVIEVARVVTGSKMIVRLRRRLERVWGEEMEE